MSRRWTLLLSAAAAMWLVWLASLPFPAQRSDKALPGTGSPDPPPATAAPSPPPASARTEEENSTSPPPAAPENAEETPAVSIRNHTSLKLDLSALCAGPLTQRLPKEGVQILILHTHGTEAYTAAPGDGYEPTDPYRTTDPDHSVIRVGEVLAEALRRQGLNVAHDVGLYDYPRYPGAYGRSEAAALSWLERCPRLAVIIDLHRDALSDEPELCRRLAASSGGAAQVMLVVGTDQNGLPHPNWPENLKLALALQHAADVRYPGLTRPVQLVRERYNQHLTAGSLILEVGTNGSTLAEAVRAAERFAEAAGPVFLSLTEE